MINQRTFYYDKCIKLIRLRIILITDKNIILILLKTSKLLLFYKKLVENNPMITKNTDSNFQCNIFTLNISKLPLLNTHVPIISTNYIKGCFKCILEILVLYGTIVLYLLFEIYNLNVGILYESILYYFKIFKK